MFFMLALFTACGSGSDGNSNAGTSTIGADGTANEAALEQHSCWQGDLLAGFYDNLGSQTKKVYSALTSENLTNILMIAFGCWMAFQIIKHLGTPSPESIGEFWTKVSRKAFLCIMCGILVSSTDQLYYVINNFIFPIYLTILEYASEILQEMGKDPDASSHGIKIPGDLGNGDGEICEIYSHSINDAGCKLVADITNFNGDKFPDGPKNMMSCMACSVSDRLGVGYNIAVRLMSGGLTPTIVGGFLMVCFTIAKLGFVFYLVDSIFRLNMMLVILPFLILFYPFEQTRKWSVTGFQIILNSSAIMLCLAVIVSMTILAMQKMLIDPNMDMDFGSSANYEHFSTVSLAMIFMGFVILKTSTMAVSLSNKVTGGGGSANFQKKVQQLVGTVAKKLLSFATIGAGKIATHVIDHFEKLRTIREKYQKAQNKIRKIQKKMNHWAGRD